MSAMNGSMSFPGFSSPAAGPEAPLDMLAACHTRVEKQCQTLERLQAHLIVHASDTAAQEAAHALLRYFNSAAKHHHEDEEVDLFPALLDAMAGSDAVCIRTLIEALEAEHRELENRWTQLQAPLQAIAQGLPVVLSKAETAAFVTGYRSHILREDRELLPMAQRLLGPQALALLGHAMRSRRGL
jgi:hemerythrin-like domain-containing protein